MKINIPLCLAIFLSSHSFAQQFDYKKGPELTKLERATIQKKTGRVLTIAGGALLSTGLIVGMNSSETTTTYGGSTQMSSEGNLKLAQASLLIGIATLGIGIPEWCVGAHREKKLKNQGVTLMVTPHTNGFTLSCRF